MSGRRREVSGGTGRGICTENYLRRTLALLALGLRDAHRSTHQGGCSMSSRIAVLVSLILTVAWSSTAWAVCETLSQKQQIACLVTELNGVIGDLATTQADLAATQDELATTQADL